MIRAVYTFVIYPLLFLAFFVLSFKDEKIRKGFQLRRRRAWIKKFEQGEDWVWFHVASGELEYAKPVIRELKKISLMRVLVTYFSPSVVGALEKTKDVDLFVPMPWDTPWHWDRFLDHYKPRCLAIARTDTWPNMVWQAKKRGIPSLLFSATLPKTSKRYSNPWGRFFFGQIVGDLTRVSCVTAQDKENFRALTDQTEFEVEGDTRFDQVIARVAENRPVNEGVTKLKPCFVAGSTWPEDEDVLFPGIKKAVEEGLKVILAPHEPTPSHLAEMDRKLGNLGLKACRYSELTTPHPEDGERPAPPAPIVIVDRVGILADLYRLAGFAFVGGGFKKSVHSVMEPAASGCLTLVGPFHQNSREALALKERGYVIEVHNAREIENTCLANMKLSDEELTRRRDEIRRFVEANKGVSQKIANWIVSRAKN